jgi:hypothetical protein
MNHDEVIRDGLIEKYLKQELSQDLELSFEEHLLYCNECREEIQKLEQLRETLEEKNYTDFFQKKERIPQPSIALKTLNIRSILPIAAGILLLIGLAGLVWKWSDIANRKVNLSEEKRDSASVENPTALALNDSMGRNSKMQTNSSGREKKLYAIKSTDKAYELNPLYEGMVANTMRSVSIKLIEPADSISVNSGNKITFKWKIEPVRELTLTILSNKGETISTLKGSSTIVFDAFAKVGLFYWKLDDDEETLAAGKIIVH